MGVYGEGMITSIAQVQIGSTVEVRVTSSLTGTIYYFWYLDGNFVAETVDDSFAFYVTPGSQYQVGVLDSNDKNFDALANAPAGYPGTRMLFWIRSTDPLIASYQLQQQELGGEWVTIATVPDVSGQWSYQFQTAQLLDLTEYEWQVIPIDLYGNAGTAVTLAEEIIVRIPDAPEFAFEFVQDVDQVMFSLS